MLDAEAEAGDVSAFTVVRSAGLSPYLLACDHAGRRVPRRLGTLGLAPSDLSSHIAWDIGIAELGTRLARTLNAFLVLQTYSRLVIDCNRRLGSLESIVTTSAGVDIPGNREVSSEEAERRAAEVFHPYHDRIRAEIERRHRHGLPMILVALHSFTPVYQGLARPWHVGVLYNRDHRLATVLLELLRQEPGLVVGENEPYTAKDETDFTIAEHGDRRAALHVELEVRQDLLADDRGQAEWAQRFARLFVLASGMFRV